MLHINGFDTIANMLTNCELDAPSKTSNTSAPPNPHRRLHDLLRLPKNKAPLSPRTGLCTRDLTLLRLVSTSENNITAAPDSKSFTSHKLWHPRSVTLVPNSNRARV